MNKLHVAALAAAFTAAGAADAAVITFSGASGNGQTFLPSSYQPLLNGYANDGGALGVTIDWGGTWSSKRADNGGVTDHTPGDNGLGVVGYDGGASTVTMSFDKDVTLASFWYANYNSGNYQITFEGFDASGASVLALTRNYSQPAGYTWLQETGFNGSRIRSFSITGGIYKQIDDISVTAVPEPATWAMLMLGFGLVGAAARRRRCVAAIA